MVCQILSNSTFKYKEVFQNFAVKQLFPNAIQGVSHTANDTSNTDLSLAQELFITYISINFSGDNDL